MAEQRQVQEFREKEKECAVTAMNIESPINLYDLDLYFNLPHSSPFSEIVLSPLWNSSDCSASTVRKITDDLQVSCHSESYSDGSAGVFNKSLETTPREGKADNLDLCLIIQARICQALRYISSVGNSTLVQFWAPVKDNSRCALTTSGQPFVLDPTNNSLHHYRMISMMYMYSADDTDDGCLGLPGRVFKTKLAEWTPNVQYYSQREYPQVNHALYYNIRGTLALPVFEGDHCVGVLELVMTSQKINYAPEIDQVCNALEAVNLKSIGIYDRLDTRIYGESLNIALLEILEVFHEVFETHKLPLAQTWLSFRHQNTANNIPKRICVSDVAFYVMDPYVWGFREACVEHHLQDEQGLPGKAFASLSACFCADISQFGKSEYPLVHYARMFGLQSSLAIPVDITSTHSGKYTFVLELFLPHGSPDRKIQWQIATSVLETTREILRNSKVVKLIEPIEGHFEIIDLSVGKKFPFTPLPKLKSQTMDTRLGTKDSQRGPEPKEKDSPLQQRPEFDIAVLNVKTDDNGENIASIIFEKDGKRMLQLLKQLFGKNLNDASNCLGVSRSTFKRLCRQHGILRWPRMKKASNCSIQIRECVTETAQLVEKASSHTSRALYPMPGDGSNYSTNSKAVIHHDLLLPQIEATTFTSGTSMSELPTEKSNTSVLLSSFGLLIGADKQVPKSSGIVSASQNGESATVKARYGEYTIKFQLCFSSQFAELENKVADRLKLEIGTFRIQYQDMDDDWILITCNDDLESCLSEWRSLGTNKPIEMLVQAYNF